MQEGSEEMGGWCDTEAQGLTECVSDASATKILTLKECECLSELARPALWEGIGGSAQQRV